MAWYSTGTINLTNNATVVTGNSTDFAGRVKVGDALVMEGVGVFEIATVDSLSQFTLARPYTGATASSTVYTIHPTSSFDKEVAKNLVDIIDSIGPARADIEFLNEYVGTANTNLAETIAIKAQIDALRNEVVAKEASTQTAYTNTVAARDVATSKRDEAVNAATAASGSAAAALASKNAAYASELNALNSQTEAAESASDAASSANSALTYKNAAETAKNAAVTAQTASETAKTAAQTAASNAEDSQLAASTSEVNAAASATTATDAAEDAEAARDLAQGYKNEALTSKTSAASSATDAQSAKADAQAAQSVVSGYKTAAETARDTAVSKANEATQAADNAADYAGLADASADAAALSETNAATSETNAAASETNAGNSASAAATSQSNAATSEANAAQSASDAADSAAAAATWDPANYATLSGATFTGGVSVPAQLIVRTEDDDTEGGQILLKTAPNQGIQGDVVIDTQGNGVRFFDDVATGRMLYWDAVNGQLQVNGQYVYHNGNNPTKAAVGLGNVDNTSDVNKPISTATQKAINAKQASLGYTPVQQGTGIGQGVNVVKIGWSGSRLKATVDNTDQGNIVFDTHLTKGNVGLGNVDNTSDAAKPISTATQNALNGKLSLDGSSGMSGTLYSTNSNAMVFRPELSGGSKISAILRNDGSNFYFLLSDASTGATATWNGLRPLQINTTTGRLISSNGQNFQGGMIVNGQAQFDTPIEGMAWPRRDKNVAMKFVWSGQGGTPAYVWGGADGTNFYPYSPSQFSVANATNATNASVLGGASGGNQGGYTRRTNDANGNGAWSRQLVLSGSDVSYDIWSPPLELREVGLVGSGSTSRQYAPGIVFHWSNVAGSALKMYPDGSLRVVSQGSTGDNYQSIWAQEHYASGWIRPTTATGMYWEAYGRGLTVANNGATYGNVNVYGSGHNGWSGWSINTWASFMSDGNTYGIHSPTYGDWLVRWDSGGNAYFPQNITAYSDERLKHNKRPIDNVTARREGMAKAAIVYERTINSMEIARAKEQGKPVPDAISETRVGFGAQTLEKAVPEVVKTADDLAGTKSVNYMDMVAILAVDNDNQAKEIDALKDENAMLKAMISDIQNRLSKGGL